MAPARVGHRHHPHGGGRHLGVDARRRLEEDRRLEPEGREAAARAGAAGHLEIKKAGVEPAGGDQLAAAPCQVARLGDPQPDEAAPEPLEVGLEVEDPAAQDLDPLVETVTEQEAPVARVDPGLGQGENPAVEVAKAGAVLRYRST